MLTIWKFPFEVKDRVALKLPSGAKFLSVQVQKQDPCMWFLVDPKKAKVEREFFIYGTGHPIENGPGEYLGTFQLAGGSLVFHIFEN